MSYNELNDNEISDRSWIATLLLAIFLPVHRFYVGKIGTGILFS